MRHRMTPTTMAFALAWLVVSCAAAEDQAGTAVQVEPQQIRVGLLYSGQTIQVSASVPACEAVVIRITGHPESLVLKKKEKKFNVLWMNAGEVQYDAVPNVYLLGSSDNLRDIAGEETLNRLQIGFEALRSRIPADAKDGQRELFGELVKLKQRDGLFASVPSSVDLKKQATGGLQAAGRFHLPAKTPLGDYTVDVFCFQNKQGKLLGSAMIHLERGAVVSFISSLVVNHGLLYGCFAVTVAVLAGLATGFLFGITRGESH